MLTDPKAERLRSEQQDVQLAEQQGQQQPGNGAAGPATPDGSSANTDEPTSETDFAQMSIAELLQLDLVLPEGAEADGDTVPATDGSVDVLELSLLELMEVRAVPTALPELPDLAPPDTVLQLPNDSLDVAPPSHLFPEGGLIPIGVLPGTDSIPPPPPPPPPPDPSVNVSPDARNDSYSVLEDALLVRSSVNGVLLNDVDANSDKLQVTLVSGPANGKLVLNSNGSFTYDSNPDFNGKDSFTYLVSDGRGGSDTATAFINVISVNDAPTIVAGSTTASGSATELPDGDADENSITHQSSGTIAFADVDLPNTHSASVIPQGSGYLGSLVLGTVDQIGDQVDWTYSVADSALDSLADGEVRTQTYNIVINDKSGGTATQAVTITLTGENDAPTIAGGTTATGAVTEIADKGVGENTATLSKTGTIIFADVDTSDTHGASVSPQGGGYLGTLALGVLNQATNRVGWTFSVDDSDLDHLAAGEVVTQYYDVAIDDGHGGTAIQTVTITITGANDAPSAAAFSSGGDVDENSPIGTVVGVAAATDPDLSDSITYSLSDDAGGRFTIDSKTGVISVADDSLLDFETEGSHSITVVTSDGSAKTSSTLTVFVNDVNEAPTLITLSDATVDENDDGAIIGNVTVADQDAGDSHSFTVSDGRFEVVGGQLRLIAGNSLDFETESSVTIDVTATDAGGLDRVETFVISVNNVAEPLFTGGDDTIDFNSVVDGDYTAGTEHDALGGNDDVILPLDSAAAMAAGYDPLTAFSAGNGDDTVTGGDLDDLIAGGGGADSLSGGAGDDAFEWDATDAAIDGGSGTDSLVSDVGNVDLTTATVAVTNIERIDLTIGGGANTLTLTAADVLAITDAAHTLTITGDNQDSVQAGTGWSGGLPDVNGNVVYTQSIGLTTVTLIVEAGVAVNADILT